MLCVMRFSLTSGVFPIDSAMVLMRRGRLGLETHIHKPELT